MITLNLFESNWWDSSKEINVLKSVNKLYFGQNNKKVGKSLNILTCFKIWENVKANFGSEEVVFKDRENGKERLRKGR